MFLCLGGLYCGGGYVGDTSELEIEVIEGDPPKSIQSEAESKPGDSDTSIIDQVLLSGTGGLIKDLDDSGDGGQHQLKEAKVFSYEILNALNVSC